MKLLTRTEEYILLAVWKLGEDAYSIPIREKLVDLTGKDWSLGAIYMPLERLEKRGYLRSDFSESTHDRGGRSRRIYKLTGKAKDALHHVWTVQQNMWDGVPGVMFALG